MDQNQFGMKELYSVQLKATLPIEIDGYTFAVGETVAAFDRIQIANLSEMQQYVAAKGGFENRERVIWITTKSVDIVFSQGIFSKSQLSILTNAKLVEIGESRPFPIAEREELETNENGLLTLTHVPKNHNIFIYNKETGEKLINCTMASENTIQTSSLFTDVIVDYEREYTEKASELIIGQRAFQGFLSLEGRTRVKDDITGITKTGIIKIPKLQLTSNLSMILGKDADPVVGVFKGKAIPVGPYGQTKVMEVIFLNEDIDSDSEWR